MPGRRAENFNFISSLTFNQKHVTLSSCIGLRGLCKMFVGIFFHIRITLTIFVLYHVNLKVFTIGKLQTFLGLKRKFLEISCFSVPAIRGILQWSTYLCTTSKQLTNAPSISSLSTLTDITLLSSATDLTNTHSGCPSENSTEKRQNTRS